MTGIPLNELTPGRRVRVTQQLPQHRDVWSTTVEGEVISSGPEPTGSWFAHDKDQKLHLDRINVKTDDGEIVVCNLDQYTHIEFIELPATPVDQPES